MFEGFGATAAIPAAYVPVVGRCKSRKADKLREHVRASVPRKPGVYGMLGRHGELIYVGKAKNLRARLMSYFRDSRDPKAGRILKHTHVLIWETVPDEFAALVRELELIRRHRPRMNVLGQPGRARYAYVAIGRAPAPYAYVTRSPSAKEIAMYGPFASAGRAKESVRTLNDWYRLRDCPQTVSMHFAEQKELFPIDRTAGCLRFEIGTCLGPCAGGCTRKGYGKQIREIQSFLEGHDDKPVEDLTAKMTEAAIAMQFERAAALRDRLAAVQWLSEKLSWLRQARKDNTFVYPIEGADGRTVWYLILRGRVRGSCFEPTDTATRETAATLLDDVFSRDTGPYLAAGQVDHVILVSGWLRKHPEKKGKLISPADATLLVQPLKAKKAPRIAKSA